MKDLGDGACQHPTARRKPREEQGRRLSGIGIQSAADPDCSAQESEDTPGLAALAHLMPSLHEAAVPTVLHGVRGPGPA